MYKILCIIRVSTDRQEMLSQRNDMLSWLTSVYSYREEEIYWLESSGASARSLNKKYIQFLYDIKSILMNENIHTIAMYHLNRLGRVESKIMEMKEYFVNNKIQVFVKNPNLSLLDNDGKLNPGANIAFSVFATMTAYDTEETMGKMQRGKVQAKKEGKYIGGFVSFGYKINENNYVVVDDSKTAIVNHIYDMYLSGASNVQIRDYINSFGYSYLSTSIKRLIRNECYRQIVGDKKFDDAQKLSRENSAEYTAKERLYNLCSKLIVCPKCGRKFYKHGSCYRCCASQDNLKGTKNFCDVGISLAQHRLDCIAVESTWHWFDIYTHQNGTERLQEVERLLSELPMQIKAIQSKIDTVEERIERYAVSYADGLISKTTRDTKIANIKQESISLSNQLSILQGKQNALSEEKMNLQKQVVTSLQNIEAVDNMSKIELYNLVHQYISHIEIIELAKYDRVFIVHCNYDGVRTYRSIGCGNAYKLYLCNPNKPGNYDDKADITKLDRYNHHY